MSRNRTDTRSTCETQVDKIFKNLPIIVPVVSILISGVLYVGTLDFRIEHNMEKIESSQLEQRDIEIRVNKRIDQNYARQIQQFRALRGDVIEVNRKLDQLLLRNQK